MIPFGKCGDEHLGIRRRVDGITERLRQPRSRDGNHAGSPTHADATVLNPDAANLLILAVVRLGGIVLYRFEYDQYFTMSLNVEAAINLS